MKEVLSVVFDVCVITIMVMYTCLGVLWGVRVIKSELMELFKK